MKNLIIVILCLVAFAFTVQVKDQQGLAAADQERGMFLFIRSTPVSEFESLGKVNMPEIVWNGRPREMMNTAVRRAKKQFPTANGLIFQSEDFGKVEAVKIK